MNLIRTSLGTITRTGRMFLLGLAVVVGSAGIAQAATTISTNVSTGGTLGVTGLSTLTAGFVSQASSTAVAAFNVSGATTLASTTATSFQVSQVGTHMSRIVSGYCVTGSAAIAVSTNVGSSTPTFMECTPSAGTAVLSGPADRVFVQATSSLPSYVILQSASTTANNVISVQLINTSTSTAVAAAIYAFNFWAFQ